MEAAELMARIRRDYEIEVPDELDATMELIIGPCVLSEKQLEVAWQAYGDGIMGWQRPADPSRPWGYWRFVLGEEQPRPRAAETIRLAELGELTNSEIAAIAERAQEAELRVGTKAEHVSAPGTEMECHPDRETAELYEAVTAALAG